MWYDSLSHGITSLLKRKFSSVDWGTYNLSIFCKFSFLPSSDWIAIQMPLYSNVILLQTLQSIIILSSVPSLLVQQKCVVFCEMQQRANRRGVEMEEWLPSNIYYQHRCSGRPEGWPDGADRSKGAATSFIFAHSDITVIKLFAAEVTLKDTHLIPNISFRDYYCFVDPSVRFLWIRIGYCIII